MEKKKFIDEFMDRLYLNGSKEDQKYILSLKEAERAASELYDFCFKKASTHQVLDLVYSPDEGQECFCGTEQECNDFIQQQGGLAYAFIVVPIINKVL